RGRVLLVTEGMTRLDVLEAYEGHDVTSLRILDRVALVGVHLPHAADALGLARRGVEYAVAFLDATRVNAREGESAEAVIHDLEREGAQGTVRIHDREVPRLVDFQVDFRLGLHLGR